MKKEDGVDENEHAQLVKDTQEKVQNEALGQFNAYVYMRNSSQKKYGSLSKNLTTRYALKENKYPKTVKGATDVLINHTWDDGWRDTPMPENGP